MKKNTFITNLKSKILLVLTVLSLIPFFGYSTHIVGGELNYKCLGGNLYEIRLRVYRDCYTGVPPFDNPAVVGIFDVNNVLVTKVLLNFPGSTVLPPTLAQKNPCVKIPTNICVEVAEYVGTVTLAPRVGGYQLSYQRCCRNPTIDNLTNPGNQGATYYARIPDQSVAVCNSNPVFKNWPPLFVCAGNPLVFDHSATDIDGDSIYYDLCAPFTGATSGNSQPNPPSNPPYTSVTYKSPFTATNPLGGIPINLNGTTGLLTGFPTILGQYVVGVCANEYRKGVLVSTTKRDFQFNVVDCQPDIVAAAGSNISDCTNHTVTFTNSSTGTNKYHWVFGDPTKAPADTSNVTNPTWTYPALGTYTVTLIAFNTSNTLCNDTTRFTVKVDTCQPCGMTLGITKVDATCGAATACVPTTPPAVGTKSNGTSANGSTTITWNHTTAGTDRFLLVEVISSSGTSTGATYGGTPLTLIDRQSNVISGLTTDIEMYYMVNPPLGTNSIVVSYATASTSIFGDRQGRATTFTGVDQTTPLNGGATKATGSTCPAVINVPSGANELVVDFAAIQWSAYSPTPEPGQTAIYGAINMNVNSIYYRSSTEPGVAGNVAMGYNWTFCAAEPWAMLGISIKPSCGPACQHYTWTHPCGAYTFANYGNSGTASGSCGSIGSPGGSGTNVTSLPTIIVGGVTLPQTGVTVETVTTTPATITACKGATISQVGSNFIFDFYVFMSLPGGAGTPGSATVTPSGGTAPYSYTWKPGTQTGPTASNLTAGTYTVTVVDAANCLQTAEVTIDAVSSIVLTPAHTDPTTCGSSDGTASVTASGGTGPLTYLWNNNQTTPTITGLSAGIYTVNVKDSVGCSKSVTITIGQPTIITETATKTDIRCKGTFGTATGNTPVGGVGPYTYSWSSIPVQATQTAVGLKAGYYVVTATDGGGCKGTAAVTILDSSLVSTSVSTNVTCFGGSTGSATISANFGTPGYTYSWNTSPVQTTPTATGLTAGTYIGIVTDNASCKDTATLTITEPSPIIPEPKNTSTVACAGATNGSAEVFVSGGKSPYTYLWCNGQNTSTASGLSQGKCFVTVTDSVGCIATDTVNIVYPPVLTTTALSNDINCFGDKDGSATVNPTGGQVPYTYTWTTIPAQSQQTAVNLGAGTYTVVVTDKIGCTSTVAVTISQPTALNLTLSSTNVTCPGANDGTATVSVSGGTPTYTYSWNSAPIQITPKATGLPGGTYTVTIVDSKGCNADTTAVILDNNPLPVANFTVSGYQPTCNDGLYAAFVNASTSASSYLWIFGDGTTSTEQHPQHGFKYGTTSTVLLIAYNGICSDTTSMVVTANPFNDYINPHIPNVFTPNGDTKNDAFEIKVGNGLENCVQITIFDRWGLKMYDNENGVPWDGRTTSGKDVPDGTYFYLVKIGESEMHGALSLLR